MDVGAGGNVYNTRTGQADFGTLSSGTKGGLTGSNSRPSAVPFLGTSAPSIISPSGGINYEGLKPYVLPVVGGLIVGYLLLRK